MAKLITVYRLEKNGFGPAFHPRHGFNRCRTGKLHTAFMKLDFPTEKSFFKNEVIDDFKSVSFQKLFPKFLKGQISDSVRFACFSSKELKSYWGKNTFETALAIGFKVVSYQVPKEKLATLKRKKQCAFCVTKAKKLS